MLLRNLVRTSRPDLRVVLMSATMDADFLWRYFYGESSFLPAQNPSNPQIANSQSSKLEDTDTSTYAIKNQAPAEILHVGGRCFPVQENFLEDILESMKEKSPVIHSNITEVSDSDLQKFLSFDMCASLSSDMSTDNVLRHYLTVPLNLLEAVIAHKIEQTTSGDILVFLAGISEMEDLEQLLLLDTYNLGLADQSKFEIHKLHSKIDRSMQSRAFFSSSSGARSIILATNIAETSITVFLNVLFSLVKLKEVKIVIDSCRKNQSGFQQKYHERTLKLSLCSRSNIRQVCDI